MPGVPWFQLCKSGPPSMLRHDASSVCVCVCTSSVLISQCELDSVMFSLTMRFYSLFLLTDSQQPADFGRKPKERERKSSCTTLYNKHTSVSFALYSGCVFQVYTDSIYIAGE